MGPHAGLVMLWSQELWRVTGKLGAGYSLAVARCEIKAKLMRTADTMLAAGDWEKADVFCDVSHNPPELTERGGIGFMVLVKPAGSGIESWGGRFQVERALEGRTLIVSHWSVGC